MRYILLLLFPIALFSQTENQILDTDVCTAQLHLATSVLSQPIVNLQTMPHVLVLEFDHMGDQLKDYKYTIVHCNSDWQPSELDDNEYIDGFTEDRINSIENSFNTLTQYTHYSLALPNQNMKWARSGNYVLKIFDTDDDRLVLVRRFMVVEPLWRIDAEFVRTAQVDKMDTHHEIDFTVVPKSVRITMPQNDVKAFVLQNGRFDNALGPIKPYITRGDNLVFDYQNQITFPAGKEFRYFDIRSFDFRGEFVKSIVNKPTYYEVTLKTDETRFDRPVIFRPEADGRFVIENQHINQTLLECDYASVLFTIKQNLPLDDYDVYVFGELSDWQFKPEFKMKYDEQAQVYWCDAWLKQGHYDYQYMVVDRKTGKPEPDGFEGNWYGTGNQYTILIYYRPFGARYDRLMGAVTLNSAKL
jgi:Domain of unknown function (DUF5103)